MRDVIKNLLKRVLYYVFPKMNGNIPKMPVGVNIIALA